MLDEGHKLRAMAEQIELELRCDEELEQPCSKCSKWDGLLDRVSSVLEAYYHRTQELERQLQVARGETWNRDRYYRQ